MIIQWIKLMDVHTPPPPKYWSHPSGDQTYEICHSFSLRIKITQKPKKFNHYQIISQLQQLTHTATENPSTNVHEKNNIYAINIQRQELNKGIHIANTPKGKMNSQHKTNALWLVTTIKEILKTPIQKYKKPIFHSGEHTRQQSGI